MSHTHIQPVYAGSAVTFYFSFDEGFIENSDSPITVVLCVHVGTTVISWETLGVSHGEMKEDIKVWGSSDWKISVFSFLLESHCKRLRDHTFPVWFYLPSLDLHIWVKRPELWKDSLERTLENRISIWVSVLCMHPWVVPSKLDLLAFTWDLAERFDEEFSLESSTFKIKFKGFERFLKSEFYSLLIWLKKMKWISQVVFICEVVWLYKLCKRT